MQVAQNANAKKNEFAETAESAVDKALTQIKNIDPEDIRQAATRFGSRVRDVSTGVYDGSVRMARQNPVRTAVGLCAFGFALGFLAGVTRKST